MRNHEIEKLLHKAVADALGVAVPQPQRPKVIRLARQVLPRRSRMEIAAQRHHRQVAEHV